MSISWQQKLILSLGFLVLAFALIWVPYTATWARSGDNYSRDIGYALVFAPPQETGCASAFGDRATPAALSVACSVRVQIARVMITAGAITVSTISLVLLLSLVKRKRFEASDFETDGHLETKRSSPNSLANQLKSRFPKIQVSSGNCTEDDPLIITAKKDYVKMEYAIAEALLRSDELEFKLASQGLIGRGNRKIDVLTYYTKPEGSEDWDEEKSSFYFDITKGFSRLKL